MVPEVKEACGVPLPSLGEEALRLTPAWRRMRAALITLAAVAACLAALVLVALGVAVGLFVRWADSYAGR